MKKHLLLIVVLCSVFTIRSQNPFNRAVHDYNEAPYSVLSELNGDLYFLTREWGKSDRIFLYKYSGNGALIYRKQFAAGEPYLALKTLDQKLIYAGSEAFCDVIPPDRYNFITKLDDLGNVLFTTTLLLKWGDNYKALVQHSDSSFSAFTDSVMFRFSKDGTFSGKTNLGLTKISSALVWSDSTLVLSSMLNGNPMRIIISDQGTLLSSAPLPVLMEKMAFYNGKAALAKGADGLLYKISEQGNVIGQSGFSGLDVTHFEIENDTFYILLKSNPNKIPAYALCDSSFNVLNLTNTTTEGITQRALCRIGNRLGILSEGLSNKQGWPAIHFFSTLNVIDKTGSNNFTQDIEIISVTTDSSYAVHKYYDVYTAFFRSNVVVRNNGPKAINSFKLNCFIHPGIGCGSNIFQKQFNNISLAPGGTITVGTETVLIKPIVGPVGSASLSTRFCFYTTLPNDEADAVLGNNEFCEDVNLLVNSLSETAEIKNLKLYPNPVNTEIKITAEEQILRIELLNAQGLVLKSLSNAGFGTTINTEDLPSGIYLIKIKSHYGSATKKVIKD